jgi:hypothetical protein
MRLSIRFFAIVAIALGGLLSNASPLPIAVEDKGMVSQTILPFAVQAGTTVGFIR